MNIDLARTAVENAFAEVAPDLARDDLGDTARLRQDLEIDSFDFLRLVQLIADSTGVETPEQDYHHLDTVGGFVDYVAAHAK
ncbi:acyl carrier protein [Leifsonia sp. C5G2]|uniref:acyl carrier protein n=1 Tax=Leifsonia sp. C5G2 TaxID=2735269 RepID=UPI001584D2D7|nr:acyl carrier protein [Leifsonia sp. C5G2]NUU07249.1 acyl carrier protein [Leifsonia sp. C5G2]